MRVIRSKSCQNIVNRYQKLQSFFFQRLIHSWVNRGQQHLRIRGPCHPRIRAYLANIHRPTLRYVHLRSDHLTRLKWHRPRLRYQCRCRCRYHIRLPHLIPLRMKKRCHCLFTPRRHMIRRVVISLCLLFRPSTFRRVLITGNQTVSIFVIVTLVCASLIPLLLYYLSMFSEASCLPLKIIAVILIILISGFGLAMSRRARQRQREIAETRRFDSEIHTDYSRWPRQRYNDRYRWIVHDEQPHSKDHGFLVLNDRRRIAKSIKSEILQRKQSIFKTIDSFRKNNNGRSYKKKGKCCHR